MYCFRCLSHSIGHLNTPFNMLLRMNHEKFSNYGWKELSIFTNFFEVAWLIHNLLTFHKKNNDFINNAHLNYRNSFRNVGLLSLGHNISFQWLQRSFSIFVLEFCIFKDRNKQNISIKQESILLFDKIKSRKIITNQIKLDIRSKV